MRGPPSQPPTSFSEVTASNPPVNSSGATPIPLQIKRIEIAARCRTTIDWRGLKRGGGTNKLGNSGTENCGNFCHRTQQDGGNQNGCRGNWLGTHSGMSRGANRAAVVRGNRVVGMRVRSLDGPRDADQGHAEHADGSEQYAPIC